MRSYIKTIFAGLLVLTLLASCGARPGSEPVAYKKTAEEVKALSASVSQDMSEQDAKRFLADIKHLLEKQISANGEDELVIVPVNVTEVAPKTIRETINYLGNMEGYPSVKVYAKMSDVLTDVYVQNGDHVKKGDILARISDMTVKNSVLQAEAALASAKAQYANMMVEYDRLKTLYDQQAVSESQWDQMVTQKDVTEYGVKQAQAAYDMALTQKGFTEITAPVSGVVSGIVSRVGDMASPQMPFASVHNIDTLSVDVSVTDADLADVHAGQDATISVNTYPGEYFDGVVKTISPVVDPMTRTALVEILVPNPENKLTAGMFARVAIIVNEKENTLVIDKALAETQTERIQGLNGLRDAKTMRYYSCYVVENDIARKVSLTTGIETETEIEILSGLNKGDLIVTMGQNNLSDSAMVRIVE